jgi:hypothetical protein
MAYKLLDYQCIFDNAQGETVPNMFQMQRIVRKLKGIRLKLESRQKDRIKKNFPVPDDEIGYEASSLLSQTEHVKKDRKP